MEFTDEKIKELATRITDITDENTKREMLIDSLVSHFEGLLEDELTIEWKRMLERERIEKCDHEWEHLYGGTKNLRCKKCGKTKGELP